MKQASLLVLPTQGVHQEFHPNELAADALSDAQNWIMRDGKMRVRSGFSAFGNNPAQRPMGIIGYQHSDGQPRLVLGTTLGWWRWNFATSTWIALTGALTGGVANQQVFRVFPKGSGVASTYLIGTNGADVPKVWDGSAASISSFGGSPPKARCMMTIFHRVLLGNLSTGPTVSPVAIDVSEFNDFDSGWGGAVLLDLVRDTPGEIVSMAEMGSLQGVIYKTDAISMAFGQGATVPFRFELKQAGVVGPCATNAVAIVSSGLHAYLALDGSVMTFDGVESRPMGRHVQRYVLNTWNPNVSNTAFGFWDAENAVLVIGYASAQSDEPDTLLYIDMNSGALWPQHFDIVRFSAGAKPRLVGGTTIGQLVGTIGAQTRTLGEYGFGSPGMLLSEVGGQPFSESGTLDNGNVINAYFQTGLSSLDNPSYWKTLYELDHLFDTAPSPQVVNTQLVHSDHGEVVTTDDPVGLDVGTVMPYVTGHRSTARRFGMRLSGAFTQSCAWQGALGHYAVRGER